MRILVLLSLIFSMASCGKKDDGAKTSALLSNKLKNTSWILPGYEVAGITFKKDIASISMSETTFISNASIEVVESDPENDFAVFYLSDGTNNSLFSISLESPEAIKIAMIVESNSLDVYKERHRLLGTIMQKTDFKK